MRALTTVDTEVYASLPVSAQVFAGDAPFLGHPLERRMTPLQRAVLSCLHKQREREPGSFAKLFHQVGCPVYFASGFGEFGSFIAEAQLINAKSLPVSPLAFQHSVQNCALGYFSILNGLHTGNLAISSGLLSLDKAIHLAYAHIKAGSLRAVCIVAADETGASGSGLLSAAESFVLHDQSLCAELPALFSVDSVTFELGSPPEMNSGGPQRWASVPLLSLADRASSFVRRQCGPLGEIYESTWSLVSSPPRVSHANEGADQSSRANGEQTEKLMRKGNTVG